MTTLHCTRRVAKVFANVEVAHGGHFYLRRDALFFMVPTRCVFAQDMGTTAQPTCSMILDRHLRQEIHEALYHLRRL